MRLKKLTLEKFKKVDKVELDLDSINVLVGGNNSGKSSVLQGIHFSVIAAVTSREGDRDTFTQESLLYCPARGFEALHHGGGYLNQSNFGWLRIIADHPDEPNASYEIRIYRGRNEGNVGCHRSGSPRIGNILSASERLFSIYVPGLAGVSQGEQFRTESVVRRGVASGDANLYLRNVLLLISEKGYLAALTERMKAIFPRFAIRIDFNKKRDVFIDVQVSTTGQHGRWCPLELAGTGVLQALQIFSYVALFEPSLLLLDEPDSHLHPDNQGLLASALQVAAAETSTQIVLSTHSRHLVDALYDDSHFVWLKDGKVFKQGPTIDRLPLLLDLGALDRFDRLLNGAAQWVFLTEDRNTAPLQLLAEQAGFPIGETLFLSYKSSSNLEAAKLLATFIQEASEGTRIVIHRDRDFMTDAEVERVAANISAGGAIAFVTEVSDIESYFIGFSHLGHLLELGSDEVETWLSDLATTEHVSLQHQFTRKRDEIRRVMYRENPDACPDTLALLGDAVPLPIASRHGKAMLKLVRGMMHERFGKVTNVLQASPHLVSHRLRQILADA